MKLSTRVKLAKYPIVLALISSAITGLMEVGSVIACLAGCGGEDKLWQIIKVSMFVIAVISIFTASVNFLFRIYKHRWTGLIVWEKAVLYLAILIAISPILL